MEKEWNANEEALLKSLQDMAFPDAIDLIYRYLDTVAEASERRSQEYSKTIQYKFLIEYVAKHDDEDFVTELKHSDLVACADYKYYPGFRFNNELCQGGGCDQCGSNLISYAKAAICPVCGSECGLT